MASSLFILTNFSNLPYLAKNANKSPLIFFESRERGLDLVGLYL